MITSTLIWDALGQFPKKQRLRQGFGAWFLEETVLEKTGRILGNEKEQSKDVASGKV